MQLIPHLAVSSFHSRKLDKSLNANRYAGRTYQQDRVHPESTIVEKICYRINQSHYFSPA
jgi:hypothetical protein